MMLKQARHKFKSSSYITLLHIYTLHGPLSRKWQAIYDIQNLSRQVVGFKVRLAIVALTRNIEEILIEEELSKRDSIQIDVVSLMKYQKLEEDFSRLLYKCAVAHLKFWQHLKEVKINLGSLKSIGIDVVKLNKKIKAALEDLLERTNSQSKVLAQYANYIKLVRNDMGEAEKIIEKLNNILTSIEENKREEDNKRMKFVDTSKICIILASGDPRKMGDIISYNTETLKIFGYRHEDLQGVNLKKLIPRAFADYHDRWMLNFFDYSREKLADYERRIFPITKAGFIFPANLIIKVIPDVISETKLIGAVTPRLVESTKFDTILFEQETNKVVGVSPGCYYRYGIHPSLTYNHSIDRDELTVTQLFCNIRNSGKNFNPEAMESPQFMSTTFLSQRVYQDKELDNQLIHIDDPDAVFNDHKVQLETREIHKFRYMDKGIVESHLISTDQGMQACKYLPMSSRIIEKRSTALIMPILVEETFKYGEEIVSLESDKLKETNIQLEKERRVRETILEILRNDRFLPILCFKYIGLGCLIMNIVYNQIYLNYELQTVNTFGEIVLQLSNEGIRNQLMINLATDTLRIDLVAK
jgi:PAS domain S-box-containing protein